MDLLSKAMPEFKNTWMKYSSYFRTYSVAVEDMISKAKLEGTRLDSVIKYRFTLDLNGEKEAELWGLRLYPATNYFFTLDLNGEKGQSINDTEHRHFLASGTGARRGRGARRNCAYWKERNADPNADLFDERELLFSNEYGGLKVPRLANLDTQLKICQGNTGDLIMSSHCARELGILNNMSTDFDDPCLRSISGHSTAVKGILRNVQFRLKGSSVTFRRNFWVCDAIDGIVDVMIGANFIKDNFKLLFEKAKECVSSFATWFSKKKETPEQKREREERERQQKIKVNELEIKRLQRENEMHQRASERNSSNSSGSAHQGGG
ncbi:hypothetical protein F4805DRAFT_458717 [Annulohypoxylon moriforme]|nr:hypothetical protein F4805DRAFT_458717 [Annulohypoxylon moriforme]